MRKPWIFWGIAACVVALALGVVAFWARGSEPLPSGRPGPEADAVARRMQEAVNHAAWEHTRALRWTFAGKHRLLWDRERGLAEVRWEDQRVLLKLADQTGLVFHAGLPRGPAKRELEIAYRYFVHDAFWLNPIATLFDPGVEREVLALEGGSDGLLVRYASGHAMAGEAYLWQVEASGLPKAWKMWSKTIPIGGVGASWEGWTTLATGLKVATKHELGPRGVYLTEIAAATTLAELTGGEDPFAPLFAPPGAAR